MTYEEYLEEIKTYVVQSQKEGKYAQAVKDNPGKNSLLIPDGITLHHRKVARSRIINQETLIRGELLDFCLRELVDTTLAFVKNDFPDAVWLGAKFIHTRDLLGDKFTVTLNGMI